MEYNKYMNTASLHFIKTQMDILASLKWKEQQQYSSNSSSEGKIIQKWNIGYATALGWVWQLPVQGTTKWLIRSSLFSTYQPHTQTHKTSQHEHFDTHVKGFTLYHTVFKIYHWYYHNQIFNKPVHNELFYYCNQFSIRIVANRWHSLLIFLVVRLTLSIFLIQFQLWIFHHLAHNSTIPVNFNVVQICKWETQ